MFFMKSRFKLLIVLYISIRKNLKGSGRWKNKVASRKSQVAAKYGIPKNTLSTWLKNKDNIFKATKKESNSKRQQSRQVTFANLDQAMFKWLLVIRSRDAADSALVFKTKAFEFAEKMNVENFKESDSWLDRWKKQFNVSFKTVSGEINACTAEIVTPWEQVTLLLQILPQPDLQRRQNKLRY